MSCGLVIALDTDDLRKATFVVEQTCALKGISGYKIGFSLGLLYGLPNVAKSVRAITKIPLIYDHQKAATDIPEIAQLFVQACNAVDAIILFPQAGPKTLEAWVKAVQQSKKTVLVGGEMTHPGFLEQDGGFLKNDTPERIYTQAAQLGVTDFVVPGNKPARIRAIRTLVEKFVKQPTFYSPGIVTQGGTISEGKKAAGNNWHPIIGRAIMQAKNPKEAANALLKELL